ncbi:MAG: hypothetical protein DMF96_03910 [Acidobacteria bacterium]|nr:MAG: hypothetical protein DMF96_03910 [Acidobacteriota bacterium]
MNGRWVYRTGIVVTALLMSSPLARAQKKYAAAFPRDGAIKLQETEFLTFWEVLHDKAKPSPMYEVALDQLTITLTEGAVKFTKPDGTSRIEQERLGAVRFESKGTVLQDEGLNDVPSREIVVLLKDVQIPRWPVTPGVPGQFPRLDAVKLLETPRIRVWDQTWLPNRPVTNHLHYTPTAAVFLSAGQFRTRDVGKPPGNPADRYIGFILAGTSPIAVPHEEEWVSGAPRAIWIEFR